MWKPFNTSSGSDPASSGSDPASILVSIESQAMQNQQINWYGTDGMYIPSVPDPFKVKQEFEKYIKNWIVLYGGLYTNPYEKQVIENLKKLLILDQVKSL